MSRRADPALRDETPVEEDVSSKRSWRVEIALVAAARSVIVIARARLAPGTSVGRVIRSCATTRSGWPPSLRRRRPASVDAAVASVTIADPQWVAQNARKAGIPAAGDARVRRSCSSARRRATRVWHRLDDAGRHRVHRVSARHDRRPNAASDGRSDPLVLGPALERRRRCRRHPVDGPVRPLARRRVLGPRRRAAAVHPVVVGGVGR